jgi:prepilin-type N-terminal cleavage/methylation domain-containing protein
MPLSHTATPPLLSWLESESAAAVGRELRPKGFTLLELLVTLAILGTLAALVWPSIGPLPRAPQEQLVERARRSAVRRAEPLVLELSASGAWVLRQAGTGAALASDTNGAASRQPLRLLFLPSGGCIPDHGVEAWDVARCTPAVAEGHR